MAKDYEEMWQELELTVKELMTESQIFALSARSWEEFLRRQGEWQMIQQIYEKLREIKDET